MTTTSSGALALDAAIPPPPRPGPPLPPAVAPDVERPSERARRSPITHVRYVALATENLAASLAFYEGIWGLYRGAATGTWCTSARSAARSRSWSGCARPRSGGRT